MEQLTQKEPHVAKVRIKSARGYEGGGGVLYLGLSYDPSTGRSGGGAAAAAAAPASGVSNGVSPSHVSVPQAGVPLGAFVTANQRNGTTGSGSGNGIAAGGMRGASGAGGGALPSLQEMPEEEWASAAGSVLRLSAGPTDDGLTFNVRVVHIHACMRVVNTHGSCMHRCSACGDLWRAHVWQIRHALRVPRRRWAVVASVDAHAVLTRASSAPRAAGYAAWPCWHVGPPLSHRLDAVALPVIGLHASQDRDIVAFGLRE